MPPTAFWADLLRILAVYAHPVSSSLNAAILGELKQGLEESGHEVDVADLYAEGFVPSLDARDLAGLTTGDTPTEIRRYQERVRRAQGLAFVFPIWWFAPPAILKGWIDRVFLENFAFRFLDGHRIEGLLDHERALVLNTAGGGGPLYLALGFDGPMKKTFCEWTLKYCGVRKVKQVIFHDVVKTGDSSRARYLKQARKLGRAYFGKEEGR